jgi:hypothetical protein
MVYLTLNNVISEIIRERTLTEVIIYVQQFYMRQEIPLKFM